MDVDEDEDGRRMEEKSATNGRLHVWPLVAIMFHQLCRAKACLFAWARAGAPLPGALFRDPFVPRPITRRSPSMVIRAERLRNVAISLDPLVPRSVSPTLKEEFPAWDHASHRPASQPGWTRNKLTHGSALTDHQNFSTGGP